ncbi:flagellar basal body-associated FliL family protein [Neptunomonas marina]|uniref:Flagellar protein FliL n=1 Tax=Neptunomonas marina TaxID=1815562 RepID=A0A437Q5F6_9GAMM|nr:flagellar basal body-associated FliL family protein [Neptunomonas marina]RVU29727.1 flagellar basal body-associated protein FliL [Neptunomonas marina]
MLLRFFSILLLSCWLPFAWAADEEGAPAEDYIGYIELKPFITNFGGPGKSRFLKCEVTIQVATEAAHHAVNAHMAHIRNDLVFLFSAQEEKDLDGIEAQQNLAKKGLKLVQKILVEEEGEAMVSDMFFTSFVTQ